MKNITPTTFNGIAGAVRWGKRIFLACGQDGLKVFELKGDRAELIARLADFPAFDLVIRNGYIAVAAGKQGIVLLDAMTLKPVRTLTTGFPVHSVSWNDNHLVARETVLGSNQAHMFPSL